MGLNHRNIVKSFCWFKEKFDKDIHTEKSKYVKYCLVMEYEESGSLFDEILTDKVYTKKVFFFPH